jgi:predicted Zn finger-like uncharacterized protein
MALAAICPHCHTMFRVASDQLKLRGGIVRCGACHEVFDGNAALVDLDAIPVQEPQAGLPDDDATRDGDAAVSDAAPAAALPAQAEQAPAEADDDEADADAAIGALPVLDSVVEDPREAGDVQSNDHEPTPPVDPVEPVHTAETPAASDREPAAGDAAPPEPDPHFEAAEYTLDFDTTLTDDVAPAPSQEAAAAADDTTADGDGDSDGPPAEAPPRPPAPGAVDSMAPLLMRASAAAEDRIGPATVLPAGQQAQARARRAKVAAERRQAALTPRPVPVAPPEPAPDDEPEFVRRGRQREESGERTRMLLIGGCVVLALALLIQGVWSFRNTLAARYPGARPVLGGVCAVMGCKVELPTQIDALAVETGELQTLDASTFSLTTLLRNQGDLVQAWPHLELALTDANDKTLVRRVFAPADYLPPGTTAARGFTARSEQSIKLTFQLNQIKASGYHLAIFYP